MNANFDPCKTREASVVVEGSAIAAARGAAGSGIGLEDEEDPDPPRLGDDDPPRRRLEPSAVGPHLVRARQQLLHDEAAAVARHDPDIGTDQNDGHAREPRPVLPFTTRPATDPGTVTGTIRRAAVPGSARSVAASPGWGP